MFSIQLSHAEACNFIKRESLTKVFSCEFYERLRAPFFHRIPPVAASAAMKNYYKISSTICNVFLCIFGNFQNNYFYNGCTHKNNFLIKSFQFWHRVFIYQCFIRQYYQDLCWQTFFITKQELKSLLELSSLDSDQIRNFLRIWSHILKKSLMENFIFCAVKQVDGVAMGPHWIQL